MSFVFIRKQSNLFIFFKRDMMVVGMALGGGGKPTPFQVYPPPLRGKGMFFVGCLVGGENGKKGVIGKK